MSATDDALSEGDAVLLNYSGEVATFEGESVEVLIDRNPKLTPQAKNQAILEGVEFSRIEAKRCSFIEKPKDGQIFTDEDGNKHKIRRFNIVGPSYYFECSVSPER